MNEWLESRKSFGNKDATPERRQWILDHIHELKDQTLGCWCNYPKEDCHGRILLERANVREMTPVHASVNTQKLRVIVAGSRSIKDYQLVCAAIKESGFNISEIVSGCAGGVDSLAIRFGEENNIPVKRFPAPWGAIDGKPANQIGQNNHGKFWKLAGFFRNNEMADYSDALIAITTGSSGTADMIERAKKKGLTIFVKEVN